MESITCDIACFGVIKDWIESKQAFVNGATSAHIFKTSADNKTMLCIFFSDNEGNVLLGDAYPMKRILCQRCDSDIEVLLNGLTIGTINL